MNSLDVWHALRGKLGNVGTFAGVLSSDKVRSFRIPLIRERSISFIANILRSNDRKLGHWVVFYVEASPINRIYFYDSYGLPPDIYTLDFSKFIGHYRERGYDLYAFDKALQGDASLICGLYCAHFIYHCTRFSISKVLRIISQTFQKNKPLTNDRRVFDFYQKKLNTKECSYWKAIDKSLVTYRQCVNARKKKDKKKKVG